jgi:hypothetical protein
MVWMRVEWKDNLKVVLLVATSEHALVDERVE